jgi:hypothetical protein
VSAEITDLAGWAAHTSDTAALCATLIARTDMTNGNIGGTSHAFIAVGVAITTAFRSMNGRTVSAARLDALAGQIVATLAIIAQVADQPIRASSTLDAAACVWIRLSGIGRRLDTRIRCRRVRCIRLIV